QRAPYSAWLSTKGARAGAGQRPSASMDPRPRGRGVLVDVERDVARVLASMEPRPRGRGVGEVDEDLAQLRVASMEPRPRGRGVDLRHPFVLSPDPHPSMHPPPPPPPVHNDP